MAAEFTVLLELLICTDAEKTLNIVGMGFLEKKKDQLVHQS